MSSPPDDELDYLLARGRLGGSQRRRILDAALASSRTSFWARFRGRLAWGAGGLALATGAAAVLLMVRSPQGTEAPFRAKGAGDGPLITTLCLGGQLTSCPSGSKLAFALEGGHDEGGFLTVYAEPIGPGERVWYLTNEPVGATQADSFRRVIGKAAVIGEGQPPGSYRVHAVFTAHPVSREGLPASPPTDALAHLDIDLTVPR